MSVAFLRLTRFISSSYFCVTLSLRHLICIKIPGNCQNVSVSGEISFEKSCLTYQKGKCLKGLICLAVYTHKGFLTSMIAFRVKQRWRPPSSRRAKQTTDPDDVTKRRGHRRQRWWQLLLSSCRSRWQENSSSLSWNETACKYNERNMIERQEEERGKERGERGETEENKGFCIFNIDRWKIFFKSTLTVKSKREIGGNLLHQSIHDKISHFASRHSAKYGVSWQSIDRNKLS